MKIGIDIDGVLTNEDEYIIDCTSKYCYENKMNGFTNPYAYEFKKLDWQKEIIADYRKQYFDRYVDNEPVRKFASEVIKMLKADGHEIYIITARHKSYDDNIDGEYMRIRIKNWLDKNKIVYDKLIFTKTPKLKEIKKYQIDVMIEDSPTTIPMINNDVKVFCYDTRYNQDLKCDNLIRVFSWYDIYMKINLLVNAQD